MSQGATGPERPAGRTDLYRPFVSRRGRRMALGVGVAQLLVLTVVALTLPTLFSWADKIEMIGFGLLVAFVLWRFASVRAVPSTSGLVVRNLVRTTRLEWPQIVAVRLGGGAPWVSLDLDDLETFAVMAIQRADGEFGQAEASRLATLIAVNSRTARDS